MALGKASWKPQNSMSSSLKHTYLSPCGKPAVCCVGEPTDFSFLAPLLGALEQSDLRRFQHGVTHATNQEESKIYFIFF